MLAYKIGKQFSDIHDGDLRLCVRDSYLLAFICLLCGSKAVSNSTGIVAASHFYTEKGIEFTAGQRLNDFCKPLGGENVLRWR